MSVTEYDITLEKRNDYLIRQKRYKVEVNGLTYWTDEPPKNCTIIEDKNKAR
jgi:hypothetical protein